MVYIGIDLGTTYSCVSVIEEEKPVVIISDDGKRTIPSVVAFSDGETLVGNPALKCDTDMANILYDSKRLIGWHVLHDLPMAEDRQLWTFNAVTKNNCAGYILNKGTRNERFIRPEEVSAEILKSLKARAEKCSNQKVTEAVVTVPAMFHPDQIAATKKAIELAGLKLKCLLQEPTAAAIAYNEKKQLGNSKLLVFDFGGGTLDISIAEIKNKNFEVKAITGDAHLGGQDFDSRIMKFVIDEFKKSSPDFDIYKKPKLLKRLRIECREAKESLSFSQYPVNIHLDITDDLEINVRLTKEKFNELCNDLFERAMIFVDRALNMAQLSPEKIDHVILVGGSTRIPKIEQNIKNKFRNSKIQFDINPDEAIAHGAAIVANTFKLADQFGRICIDNPIPTPDARPVSGGKPAGDNQSSEIGGGNSSNNSHKTLFYLFYRNNDKSEGRIGLFNSYTCSVEKIAKFHNRYWTDQVAITQNKIFGIDIIKKSFEIYDLNTRQISRGPNPPECRDGASVAYFKDNLYYLSGWDSKTYQETSRVDVLIDGKWQTGPAFPLPISDAQPITCDGSLYVIGGWNSNKIYRLADDERRWIKIGEIPEQRYHFGVASLNGKIYMTGGWNSDADEVFKSCLCFDPSAPVGSRISRIADMNYARHDHSLIVANGKLYAVGGFQETFDENFCNSIEEYDPQTNEWRKAGKINLQIGGDNLFNNSHQVLFYYKGRICLFNSYTYSVEKIAKFHNRYWTDQVAITQNEIFEIDIMKKSFKIYELNIGQFSRGPNPPEWRSWASVVYFKDKLYYLGGWELETRKKSNHANVLIDGKWQTGPAFPHSIVFAQTITCDGSLYVIDGEDSNKIYRLSDDEREWIEIGEIPERLDYFEVASLNGKIYITGGWNGGGYKSCLCFDPSAPADSRFSRIADINYARCGHLLIVANGKLYAIRGFQETFDENFCNSIEEYDPQTKKWREVGKVNT